MSCSIFISFGKSTAANFLSPLERQRPINCQARRSLTAPSLFEVTRATSCTLGARSSAPANVATLMRKSWPKESLSASDDLSAVPGNSTYFVAILDTQPADDEDGSNLRSGFPRCFDSLPVAGCGI